jgi:cell fate (sporulation/competence/biofilm development) regulator YlbF (YheA/YmcA/DUF963 family)
MEQSEILERAKALGKLLADNPRVKAYLETQQGLQRDERARKLLRDYQLLAEKLQRQQAEGKQIAPQDAEQLGKFEQDLATNDAVKVWLRAQSDYVDLMYRVDRSIQEGLAEAMGRPSASQQKAGAQGPAFTPRIVPPPGGKAEA